jgi:hypothetical protein
MTSWKVGRSSGKAARQSPTRFRQTLGLVIITSMHRVRTWAGVLVSRPEVLAMFPSWRWKSSSDGSLEISFPKKVSGTANNSEVTTPKDQTSHFVE